MLQDVAMDHDLASECVCLRLHGNGGPSCFLDHQGVMPVPYLEVAAPVFSRWHAGDLKRVDVNVQRVGADAHRPLVHLPNLKGRHRRPVPHCPGAVDVGVRHAATYAVIRDGTCTAVQSDRASAIRHRRPQVRQVARPQWGERLQNWRADGGAPIDSEQHDVDLHHPCPRSWRWWWSWPLQQAPCTGTGPGPSSGTRSCASARLKRSTARIRCARA
mmetsp:Transcript_96528/g.166368  ORF Transcript_96528/g.166368 Transcript_96528/m.166368 type:complete len:216 (-) Transcript_96528:642-1289(-)